MLRLILASILMITPCLVKAETTQTTEVSRDVITGEQLRDWYADGVEMIVVDARTKAYFNGIILPDAQWLPARSSEETILQTLPAKDHLIVVYCLGVTCPASKLLYDQLISMNYTNVFEYHEGLQDWLQKGYPVEDVSAELN